MREKANKDWLYILPHSYCNIKEKEALIYNTLTGEYIEVSDVSIISLLREMHQEKNLGTALISEEKALFAPYKEFIEEFTIKKMGKCVPVDELPERPVQLMPILNLQRDIDRIKDIEYHNTGDNLNRYLWELNVYLNSDCDSDCAHCMGYAQQVPCCRKEKRRGEMSMALLENIASQIQHTFLCKIHFLGGDILQYGFLGEIERIFHSFKGEIHLFNHVNKWKKLPLSQRFIHDVIVTFPVKEENVEMVCNQCIKDSTIFHFYITSEEEYMETESLITRLNIQRYVILPYYSGSNELFFQEFAMQDKTEILEKEIISFRKLFTRQKMNNNFFGKLTILADGDVYASLGREKIGNLNETSLLRIIHEELLTNTAWRKIRADKPCTDCLLQYICPSPSTYEFAIGRSNLCLVK